MRKPYNRDRRTRVPLTDHEILSMRVMVQEGLPLRLVAIRFNVDVSTVSRHAPVGMGMLKLTEELVAAMCKARGEGATYRAIAKRYAVSLGVAHRVCSGVPLPKGHARAGQPRKFVADDVKALEASGLTSAQIAARIGLKSATSVRTMMWRYRKMEAADANRT